MRFEERVWRWERDVPLRCVLTSEEWDGEQTLWGKVADADDLFVGRPNTRELLTLVGCTPQGRLRRAGAIGNA